MKKIKVIGLLGRSGTGKNTVADHLRIMSGGQIHVPLLTTSRPKRPGEIEGVEYHFVTKEKALKQIEEHADEIVWHSCFNDWYYYLPVGHLSGDKLNLCVLNPAAAVTMAGHADEWNLEIRLFELTLPDYDLWLRVASRPDLDEVARRWPEDKKDFSEPHYTKLPVCRLENKNSEVTSHMLYNYIRGMEDAWTKSFRPSIWNPRIYECPTIKE